MKFILILLIAVAFNISAQAQDPENPGKPADEMTLVGKGSEKPIQLEDKSAKKKTFAKKKNKKSEKSKKADQ
ncbi:MAG: hypothetical protein ACXWRE_16860 [Pseudobdellovibrionaceae bacterium]